MPRKRVKFGEEASSVNRLRDNRYKHSNPIDANTGKVRRGRPRKEYIENNITRIALNEENLRKKQEEERIKAEKRVAQKQKNILSLIEHHKKAISRLDEKTTDNQASDLLEEVYLLMMDLTDNDIKKDINLWVRQECKKHPTEKCYKLFHKTFINGARLGSFDDYMVATEWRRVDNARFWLPRRKVLEGKHHICSQIDEFIKDPNARYLGISVPPGCGKTTLIKFLLSYVCGLYPDSASMYCSANDGIVKMVYDSVTAMLTDTDEYDHNVIFPGSGLPTCSAEYKTISYRNKGDFPTVGMVSIGGSVTGRTRANKFLITDDLVQNKEMARSPERLNRLFEDYTATLTTRKIGDDVKEIQLGTIWSVHDPISRMREKYKDDKRYKFIAIPVCDEEGHSNFNYDHPDRYTDEKIAEIRNSLDPADFSCLYLQQGIDKEGLAFDGLRFYNGVLPDGEPDNIVMVADIAWGGGDSLSMPIAYIYGDEVYIHDVVFDNRDKTITKPRVVGKLIQHHVRKGRMEANNGGDEYCDDVKRMLVERGYSMNLSHKKASTRISKISKIEQHAPTIRTFYFLDKKSRSKEYDKFMRELESYSFTSKNLHDDAPDSLAMLCEFIYNNKTVVSCRPLF